MPLEGADILTAAQFSRDQVEGIFARADDFAARLDKGERVRALDGKLLATIFYEPSTRTRLSFEAAMQRLGGGVISVAEAKTASSVVKGETLPDTIRTLANYADAIVLRHPEIGAAQIAAEASAVPVFNAGDGAGEHPTQALLDLYTIRAEKKTLDEWARAQDKTPWLRFSTADSRGADPGERPSAERAPQVAQHLGVHGRPRPLPFSAL